MLIAKIPMSFYTDWRYRTLRREAKLLWFSIVTHPEFHTIGALYCQPETFMYSLNNQKDQPDHDPNRWYKDALEEREKKSIEIYDESFEATSNYVRELMEELSNHNLVEFDYNVGLCRSILHEPMLDKFPKQIVRGWSNWLQKVPDCMLKMKIEYSILPSIEKYFKNCAGEIHDTAPLYYHKMFSINYEEIIDDYRREVGKHTIPSNHIVRSKKTMRNENIIEYGSDLDKLANKVKKGTDKALQAANKEKAKIETAKELRDRLMDDYYNTIDKGDM